MPQPRRRHRVEVHFNDQEYAALLARSRPAKAATVAGYVRAAALGQPVPVAAAVPAANVAQFIALGHAAANLNQVAKHLNQGNILTDRDLMPVLRQLYEDVQQVRRALLGTAAP